MGSPASRFDVVVVGGGPAGSAAALWCAKQELRVVLLERERFPRHRPGETLLPGVEPILQQLGVANPVLEARFSRHPGTWVTWSGPRRFDAFGEDSNGPWLGFQAPRDVLDRILLEAAAGAGVIVRQPCRALRPMLDRGAVIGVETSEGPLTASWVLDAGGGAHWLARSLDIPVKFASPRLIARYGYVRGDIPERYEIPEIVADDAGWTWSARIAPGLYHWTRMSFQEVDPLRDCPPRDYATLTPVGRPRGADVTWRMVDQPAGPGFICVGDAAAVLDPASSHGVLKGLMSGMMAAHVIGQVFAGTASPLVATRAYTGWVSEWFEADVKELTRLYGELPHAPDWIREGIGASMSDGRPGPNDSDRTA